MSLVDLIVLVAGLIGYVALGRILLGKQVTPARMNLFAVLNLAAVWLIFYRSAGTIGPALLCLALLAGHFAALHLGGSRPALARVAILLPVVALVAVKAWALTASGLEIVGISYLAFRLTHLALEVRNRVEPPPSLGQYLSFALFLPTLVVGPISPYSLFRQSLVSPGRPGLAIIIERLLVGATKYFFFAPLLLSVSYRGLVLDGHPHPFIDLPIAAVAYYLYVYCNFSGFCDLAIAGAGLMGIRVAENFAFPLGARNVKDFWNRWHITLSSFMRDTVFNPVSKNLTRAFGPRALNHAIAVTILTVFLLIGLWHGVGINFLLFGLLHGLAVVANHYYTLVLKNRLGATRFRAYMKSRVVKAVSVTLTFAFVSGTMILFANDFAALGQIRDALMLHESFQDPYVPMVK